MSKSTMSEFGFGNEKKYDTMKEVLFTPENLEFKTDLLPIETALHSLVNFSNDNIFKFLWGVDLKLDQLIMAKEKRLVSKKRLGRIEAKEILKEAEIKPETMQNDTLRRLGFNR